MAVSEIPRSSRTRWRRPRPKPRRLLKSCDAKKRQKKDRKPSLEEGSWYYTILERTRTLVAHSHFDRTSQVSIQYSSVSDTFCLIIEEVRTHSYLCWKIVCFKKDALCSTSNHNCNWRMLLSSIRPEKKTDIEVAQLLWQKFREMSLRVDKYFVKIDFLEMLD